MSTKLGHVNPATDPWFSTPSEPYFNAIKDIENREILIRLRRFCGGLATVAALAMASAWAADLPVTSAVYSAEGSPPEPALAAYRTLSASQSRNYDRAQDISPRQLLILLEVSQRIAASLGQALATGEHESARTWNDHVRPTLKNGTLGSATGVWQFQPATFHSIAKKFGTQLLAASEADAATGRERMDLGDGPFDDATVRSLIQETVDGKRGAEDEELQLLRHNFAVLAFAKHYLSVDSGATNPEEDYLFHFLGTGQGRRILALAQGEARDTLCVKPVEVPVPALETQPELAARGGTPAVASGPTDLPAAPTIAAEIAMSRIAPGASRWGLQTTPPTRTARDRIITRLRAEGAFQSVPRLVTELTLMYPLAPYLPPLMTAQWGLPADSSTVTGNLGMFYRDGKGQTQPYTWAEFMENLGRRVRAKDQPALVRAKYGVGFDLTGGDMPQWAFRAETLSEVAEFRHESDRIVLVPEALVTGPLSLNETRQYQQRLAALVHQGEDKPMDTLPPEALSALHHLRVLPSKVREISTTHPQVQKALHNFRKLVGKDEPDDPAHFNLLMPAERIALEIYDQRVSRYAALQAGQLASFRDAPDLTRIKRMPKGLQQRAAFHIAALQTALGTQGLLTQPTQKSVWRDKKRKKHVDYKTLPFAGKADKATATALNTYQWRNGLRQTEGILDTVTLSMLNLPPMGREIFLPPSGPQCPFNGWADTPMCELPTTNTPGYRGDLRLIRPYSTR